MSANGSNGVLTVGSVVQYVRDVQIAMSASEGDDTSRANQGWESVQPGLRKWRVDFDMVVNVGDTIYTSLLTSFVNGSGITATAKDALNNSIGGSCCVVKFDRTEPLDGVVTCSVTLAGRGKPTVS